MKTLNILYENQNSFSEKIKINSFPPNKEYFVKIFTANATQDYAVKIAQEIKEILPECQIIGSSASGIIFNGVQYADKNLVVIEEYNYTQVYTNTFVWEGKSAQNLSKEINKAIEGRNVKIMHILFSDHYHDVHNFIVEFNIANNKTHLIGGISGDVLPLNIPAYIFTHEGIINNGVIIGAICSDDIYEYTAINIAHEPISLKHTLTSCEGDCWKEINGQAANEWFREQLGIESMREYNDWQVIADNDIMIHFPVVLENHSGASRFLKYDDTINGITQYFSKVPVNTEFRIGYVSPAECVKESLKICNEIMEQPIETLFSYSCLFRRLYLNNCAQWELSPYGSVGICGAFMMGEIGSINGVNEFLNGSCCIVGIAERKKYIRPDISVFEELNKIKDDTTYLLNMVLKKQSENVSKYNEELLDKLILQQKSSEEQIYIDFNTGIGNYLKYKDDNKKQDFNKMCMVKVENADLIITHSGHESYVKLIKKATIYVREYMSTLDEYAMLKFYSFNDNTFFVTANNQMSDSHFIDISKIMFDKFRFIKMDNSTEVLVNRFVVVTNQKELIEISLNTFHANKNIQSSFSIFDTDTQNDFSTAEEFNIIGVINRALENDGVVPYFQGIFDNLEKRIIKYEALMRIVDVDSKVYSPAQFMSIAKKYHLYPHLSRKMIKKVFDLFEDKKETVSINFSAYDINSDEMQKIIFDRLASIENPENFVLEILEDEEFRDIDVLKTFIAKAKKFGVKIAIDDFGSGYSNLLEIVSINPDYIKVDGGIIRNLHDNELNRKILDIIIFLGEHFNTEIIAEYVENKSIQEQIEIKNIRYSQGYYFSMPLPYEKLELN